MSLLSSAPPVSPPGPPQFQLPQIGRLDNGLEIRLVNLPGQHVISVTAVIDAPLGDEPVEGLGAITARTLDEGTTELPGREFAERLESLGAEFGAFQDLNGVIAGIDVPASQLPKALRLLAQALSSPALAQDDVNRHIALRLAEIDQQRANPAATAAREFRRTVFAERCRAARPVGGDRESVELVTTQQVREFHASRYAANRTTVIIGGDLAQLDPYRMAADAFGDWHTTAPERPLPIATAGRPQYQLVDRPDAVQANVQIGGFGIDRSDPRWPAFRIALHAIGGAFGSRLNLLLREELGYTYGVRLTPAPLRTGGSYALTGSFRTGVAGDAVARALDLMDIDDQPITDAEVADAVNYYIGAAPMQWATADSLVDQYARQLLDGLPDDHLSRQLAALTKVDAQTATEAYREIVTPEGLSLVIVGQSSVLRGTLPQGEGLQLQTTDER